MVDRFQKLDFRSQSGALSYRELRTAKGHHLWSRKLGPTCFDHKIQNSSKSTNLSLGHRCLKYNSTRSRCWCKKKVKSWFSCRNKPKLCSVCPEPPEQNQDFNHASIKCLLADADKRNPACTVENHCRASADFLGAALLRNQKNSKKHLRAH